MHAERFCGERRNSSLFAARSWRIACLQIAATTAFHGVAFRFGGQCIEAVIPLLDESHQTKSTTWPNPKVRRKRQRSLPLKQRRSRRSGRRNNTVVSVQAREFPSWCSRCHRRPGAGHAFSRATEWSLLSAWNARGWRLVITLDAVDGGSSSELSVQ